MKLKTPLPLLTAGQEIDLARRVRGSDPADALAARNELVLSNLGLIGTAAAYYARRSDLDYDDLFSEGVLAMIEAIPLFDPARHCRFSTYASPAIFHRLHDCLDDSGMVRVPKYLQRPVYARRGASPRARARLDANLDAAALASRPVASLMPSNDRADPRPSALRLAELQDEIRQALGVLETMPPLRAYLLASRLGLYGMEPRTLDAIGRELGLSRERIRQLVAETVAQLGRQIEILARAEII